MKHTRRNFLFFAFISVMFTYLFVSVLSHSTLLVYAQNEITANLQQVETQFDNNVSGFNNFAIKNNNEFYFTDIQNDQVVVWNNEQTTQFGSFGSDPEDFVDPSLITVLPNEDIYIYDSLRRLKLFNSSYNFITNFNMVQTGSTYLSLGRLSSLTNDLANNLYALDYENNLVLKKSAHSNEITQLIDADSLGFTINSNSQIVVSPSGNSIFLSNINSGNNIYYINNLSSLNEINILNYNITSIDQIAIDCANNLFILEKNATDSSIHKLTKNNYNYESYLTVENNQLSNINKFNINLETGQIVALNLSTNTLDNINPTQNELFTENISSFVDPIDYTQNSPLTEPALIATTTIENVPLLQTPYNITPITHLNQGQKVIILSQVIENNPDYYYVLFINNGSQVNIDGYILKENLQILNEQTQDINNIRILNNQTNLYKYPTSLNSYLGEPVTVGQVSKNEELPVIDIVFNITDAKGVSFYKVQINTNNIAYIRKLDAVQVSSNPVVPTLSTNAEIIITDASDSVNVYENYENENTLLPDSLEEGTRVYIENYSENSTWTQITFINSQDEEQTGYVKTKYIRVYSNYSNLLQAFALTIISFILIVILILIKTNKKTEE